MDVYTEWAIRCGINTRAYPDHAGGLSQGTGTGSWYEISHTLSTVAAPEGDRPAWPHAMVTLDMADPRDFCTRIRGEMTPDVARAIAASLVYHAEQCERQLADARAAEAKWRAERGYAAVS